MLKSTKHKLITKKCVSCGKEMLAKNIRKIYCDTKCQYQYRKNDPKLLKKYRKRAYDYWINVRGTPAYAIKRRKNYESWYSKPKNKLKQKLYARQYYRDTHNIPKERYKV